jgi:hypothetical protein
MVFLLVPGILGGKNGFVRNVTIWRRVLWPVSALVIAVLFLTAPAQAQSPPGCTDNGVILGLQPDRTATSNNQTVTYTVTLGNGPFPACDVSINGIQGFCPDSGGNPTQDSTLFDITTTLPPSTTPFDVGTFQCKVTVDPGVQSATASAEIVSGTVSTESGLDIDGFSQSAAVTVITTPQQIPTLSGWAMAGLAVLLAIAGAFVLRRTRAA